MENEYTVLVAEDSLAFSLPIVNRLKDVGFKVISVDNLAGILQYGSEADILLVDVRLPTAELEGIEGVARLISKNSLKISALVIFMSILSELEYVCQQKLNHYALSRDRYIWLNKPINMDSLVTMITSGLPKESHLYYLYGEDSESHIKQTDVEPDHAEPSLYGKVNVELNLNYDFDSFSTEEKARVLYILRELFNLPEDLFVPPIESGKAKSTTAFPYNQLEQYANHEISGRNHLEINEDRIKEKIQERARKVERHTMIDFPEKCFLHAMAILKIQLAVTPIFDITLKDILTISLLREFAQFNMAIHITAPAFNIQPSLKMMRIPADEDSEVVTFPMLPIELGMQVIEIEMFCRAERVGYYTIESEVIKNG